MSTCRIVEKYFKHFFKVVLVAAFLVTLGLSALIVLDVLGLVFIHDLTLFGWVVYLPLGVLLWVALFLFLGYVTNDDISLCKEGR